MSEEGDRVMMANNRMIVKIVRVSRGFFTRSDNIRSDTYTNGSN